MTFQPYSKNDKKLAALLSSHRLSGESAWHVHPRRQQFTDPPNHLPNPDQDLEPYQNLETQLRNGDWWEADQISDAGWSTFRKWLEYFSQNCSNCGKTVRKALSVRTHLCPHCGYRADRDVNAAINILQR